MPPTPRLAGASVSWRLSFHCGMNAAERLAWSWTSTLEIRPDLENDEIAGWRRRGHRDADARRGARFYPGRWALPHPRDMAPFIPLWNECRQDFGLPGHPYLAAFHSTVE